jgi:hypothetical protein
MAAPPTRPVLTRTSAIDAARQIYQTLVERALRRPGADQAYILELHEVWDDRLASLADVGRFDTSLPDHTQRRFDFLNASVNVVLDDDALLRWLDAFPEAMAELMPPSASTFRPQAHNATTDTASLIRSSNAA